MDRTTQLKCCDHQNDLESKKHTLQEKKSEEF